MLSPQNIESELSYAYLHAVASRAGFSCEYRNRHLDGAGIDATVTEDGRYLASDSTLAYVPVDVQLKATYQHLAEANGKFSYSLDLALYDRLRKTDIATPRILVVLRLPESGEDWLKVTSDCLVAKRCAYWVSMYGAPTVTGQDSKTVYIPTQNVLSPEGLRDVMTRFSRQEDIQYEE